MVLDYFRSGSGTSSGGPSWQAQQHRNRLTVRRYLPPRCAIAHARLLSHPSEPPFAGHYVRAQH